MGRKRTKKSIGKSCDDLWSKCIRARDVKCIKCGKPSTEAHHIFGRRNKSTRWDLRNGIGLCSYCHVFDKHGFEQAPHDSVNVDLLYEKFGAKTMAEIDEKTYQITKHSLEDLLEIEKELKHNLELLTEANSSY